MERMICLFIGYLFGLFQTSYIYGRMKGIDIRNYGSGNAGTTNMFRTLGKKAGVLTFLGDVLKCIFAVLIVRVLFESSHYEMMPLLTIYTAAGVILGHNFPFYLHFKGGKGIAATMGLIFAIDWRLSLMSIVTFFVVLGLTHYVSLGSLIVYTGFVTELIIFGQLGLISMRQSYLNEMYLAGAVLMILAFWMHRENIKRLLDGVERKTFLFKKG